MTVSNQASPTVNDATEPVPDALDRSALLALIGADAQHPHAIYDAIPFETAMEPEDFVTSGGKWGYSGTFGTTGGTVTWSIAGGGWSNGSPDSTWFSGTTRDLSSFLSFDYAAVLTGAFAAWSSVANINFVQVADGGGSMGSGSTAMIRISGAFMDGSSNVLAAAFFPASAGNAQNITYSGDINFDSGETTFWNPSSFRTVAMHEIGHSIGLRHTSVSGSLMNPFYNPAITAPQSDDIAGARAIYGAAATAPPITPLPPAGPSADKNDFNGDGKADILWQNSDGTPGIWLMDGFNRLAGANVGLSPGTSWKVKDAGDFNSDGRADILWQNDNGQPAIWLMNGLTSVAESGVGSNPGPTWKIKDSGDFNGDGRADVLWQNDNGQPAIWLMNGLAVLQESGVGFNPGPTWKIKTSGDFNGDGKADILWQNDNGTPGIWLMDGFTVVAENTLGFNPGSSWHIVPPHHDLG
jgi:matrixin/VCBS repeat protein